MMIRDVKIEDCPYILGLNEENAEMLLPMDSQQFMYFVERAGIFKVVELDGNIVAFLIALRDKTDYNIQVYRWFLERHPNFIYIDRIVIDEAYRRLGIARMLYEYVFDYGYSQGVSIIAAGVEIEPIYNKASMALHNSMGFAEVGEQYVRNGAVKVSLQERVSK